jgi:hypothetical protein
MEYGLKVTIKKIETPQGFELTGIADYDLKGTEDDIDYVGYIEELQDVEDRAYIIEEEESEVNCELIESYDLTEGLE